MNRSCWQPSAARPRNGIWALILSLALLPIAGSPQQSFQPSPALAALFQQTEQTMLQGYGMNFSQFVNEAPPAMVSLALGFAMQAQFRSHAVGQPDAWPRMSALQQDVEDFLDAIVQARGFRDADGSPLGRQDLVDILRDAMHGDANELAMLQFGYDPGTPVPSVLHLPTLADPATWTPTVEPASPSPPTPSGSRPSGTAGGTQGLSRDECEARYCPMCSASVTLLRQSVDPACTRCLREQAQSIQSCMTGGSAPAGGSSLVTPTLRAGDFSCTRDDCCRVVRIATKPNRYAVVCDPNTASGTTVFGPARRVAAAGWMANAGIPYWEEHALPGYPYGSPPRCDRSCTPGVNCCAIGSDPGSRRPEGRLTRWTLAYDGGDDTARGKLTGSGFVPELTGVSPEYCHAWWNERVAARGLGAWITEPTPRGAVPCDKETDDAMGEAPACIRLAEVTRRNGRGAELAANAKLTETMGTVTHQGTAGTGTGRVDVVFTLDWTMPPPRICAGDSFRMDFVATNHRPHEKMAQSPNVARVAVSFSGGQRGYVLDCDHDTRDSVKTSVSVGGIQSRQTNSCQVTFPKVESLQTKPKATFSVELSMAGVPYAGRIDLIYEKE